MTNFFSHFTFFFRRLRLFLRQWRGVLLITPIVSILIILISYLGFFQFFEWSSLDSWFRLRASEPIDPRIVLITIDEEDINYVYDWPIPDKTLADLIEKIKAYDPREIGLGLYRGFPVRREGHEELMKVFQTTPNIIGLEQCVDRVRPPKILADLDRVGCSDIVLDQDGKVRRGLISLRDDSNGLKLSFSAKLALDYLRKDNILPDEPPFLVEAKRKGKQLKPPLNKAIQLGKATFIPLSKNDGAYVRLDNGGYQILLNYRGDIKTFKQFSMRDVLLDKADLAEVKDKVVIIGSIASSINEFFLTPYTENIQSDGKRMPGLAIHANLISQIISSAEDGRLLFHFWSNTMESAWIVLWSFLGALSHWKLLQGSLFRSHRIYELTGTGLILIPLASLLFAIGYFAFLKGYWIPVIAPFTALIISTLVITSYHNQGLQRLASLDDLTQIANRRCFDEFLDREWLKSLKENRSLSLILCDVDCFKLYNDTYGHQAGDNCLYQVAQAICQAVRPTDLVARYGGEEFAIVLPNTTTEQAQMIAQRVRIQIKALQMDHLNSLVDQYVTLSCGVASLLVSSDCSPITLISCADQALYKAKKQGRDRVIVH